MKQQGHTRCELYQTAPAFVLSPRSKNYNMNLISFRQYPFLGEVHQGASAVGFDRHG